MPRSRNKRPWLPSHKDGLRRRRPLHLPTFQVILLTRVWFARLAISGDINALGRAGAQHKLTSLMVDSALSRHFEIASSVRIVTSFRQMDRAWRASCARIHTSNGGPAALPASSLAKTATCRMLSTSGAASMTLKCCARGLPLNCN